MKDTDRVFPVDVFTIEHCLSRDVEYDIVAKWIVRKIDQEIIEKVLAQETD